MIEFLNISKRFGPIQALENVSLQIADTRVLGLLGENGAGKSTLMHILFGLIRPDVGEIRINGHAVKISSPRKAQRLAIGMVHQHFRLVPTFTVLENFRLFLPLPARALAAQADAWRARLNWSVPLDVRVENLSVGQQQRAEIIKALLTLDQAKRRVAGGERGAEESLSPVLILDEPTAVLTPEETRELFSAIAALRDSGATVVLISHKLAEIRGICDAVAILRRGKMVHTGPLAEISDEALAEKMIGAAIEMPRLKTGTASRTAGERSPPMLVLENISTAVLKDVSLAVHPGEILGIAGVDGNGQSHLVASILNTLSPPGISAGSILIQGNSAAGLSTRERLNSIAFIPEDRQHEALVLPLSVEQNLLLKDYRRPEFSRAGFSRFSAWRSHARKLVKQFDVRTASVAEPAGRLSGGNQQKLVLARELSAADKPILLAVNPTRGLDIGATAFVIQKLLDARAAGAAILLIHYDLDELLAISDRVAVLYRGRLSPTPWPQCTKEQIGRLMLGLAAAASPEFKL